ncbi:hypothetical protein F5884DRAFT_494327 [Xylogone sp. PMI_703]|nr:hypothetical protein F5884DRAFT_494327 [Xylogone sp. PMI_703]
MNERELLYFEAKNYKGPVVIFLPRVIELLKTPKFRDDLAKKFHINDFFLTKTAYDSNGFFRHYNEPNVASACRFLIKELSQIPESSKFRDEKKTIQKVLLPELLESAGADAVDIVSVPEVSNESLLGEFLKKWQEWKKEHYNSLSQNSEEDKANSESFRILSEEDDRQNIQAAIEDLDRILKGFENNDFFQHLHAVIDEWDNLPDGAATFRWLSKSVRKDLYKLFMEALANSIHQPVCIMGRSQKSQVKESLPQNEELSGGNNGSQQSEQKTPGVPQESEQKGHGAQQQSKRKAQRQNNSRMVGWWNGKQSQRKDSEDKEDKKDKLMHTYHWFFLFFWTVFLHHNNEDPPPESHGIPPQGGNGPLDPEGTQIFLCFDDASGPKMKEIIKKILEMRCGLAPLGHNSVLLPQVVEEVLHVYDTALWGFRSPVRDIEKRRQEHIGKIKKDFNIYFDMHELSRHLIHSEETLAAAETTLNAILQSDWPLNTSKNSTIQFSLTFIKNLNLRAKAFIERLENEIRLAYHINNVRQLVQVDELLRESRNDGKDVAKFVGYASIVFLPGTFVSGFFSMTFFGFVPESSTWGRTGHWWIWFAITIPITLIGVFLFAWRHSEEKLSQFLILVLTLRIFYRVNRQEKK